MCAAVFICVETPSGNVVNEWMNKKKIYKARLKAYKCMLNLPRLAEN